MTFLGFVDDVIDLRWRYKVILPVAAALPLVIAYRGSTVVVVPSFLREIIGIDGLLQLGFFYQIYMTLLTVFFTNSINIYAGRSSSYRIPLFQQFYRNQRIGSRTIFSNLLSSDR